MDQISDFASIVSKYWQIFAFSLGGLAFLAYNHYKSYKIIAYVLYFLSASTMIILTAFNQGLYTAYHDASFVKPAIEADKIHAYADIVSSDKIPHSVFNVLFALNVCLLFMYCFPLLGIQRRDEKQSS